MWRGWELKGDRCGCGEDGSSREIGVDVGGWEGGKWGGWEGGKWGGWR